LTSGWTPAPTAATGAATALTATRGRCPFTGASAGTGACPARAASSASSYVPRPAEAGRLLGDPLQTELDALLLEDPELVCPITLTLLLDPVVASDGCVYERAAVVELTRVQGVSPVTHAPFTNQVLESPDMRERVLTFMRERSQDLIGLVSRAKKQGKDGLALAALDRLKDYLPALHSQGDASELVERFQEGCRDLGRMVPTSFGNPQDRITKILREQVARAKAEGETVLQERAAPGGGGEKSVLFCVDTSGSMHGMRIQKAQENLLRIFDRYIEDEDYLAFTTFSNWVSNHLAIGEVGASRSSIRSTLQQGTSRVGGGTAFWDALIECTSTLRSSPSGLPQWIVALTDGEDQLSRQSLAAARGAIREAPGSPNLIVIGIQLNGGVKQDMVELCKATDKSIFIDASGSLDSLDDAFDQVVEMICE